MASPDGRSYHLVLREGLRDWDGAPLGAAELARGPGPAAPAAAPPRPTPGSRWPSRGPRRCWPGAPGSRPASRSSPSASSWSPSPSPSRSSRTPWPPRRLAPALGAGGRRRALPAGRTAWTGRLVRPAAPPGRPAWRPTSTPGAAARSPTGCSSPRRSRRAAARALQAGELDLSLRPDAAPAGAADGPPDGHLRPARPRRASGRRPPRWSRQGLAALDRADLARRLQRAPAEPLAALLPPPLLPAGATPLPPGPARPGRRAARRPGRRRGPGWCCSSRPGIGERAGPRRAAPGASSSTPASGRCWSWPRPPRSRPASPPRDYDLALLQVTLLSTAAPLAAGQVAGAVAGPGGRLPRRAGAGRAGGGGAPGRRRGAARRAGACAAGHRLRPRRAVEALRGLALRPDGGFDAGDLWRLPGAEP